jgi:C4-type Zn-finger protein
MPIKPQCPACGNAQGRVLNVSAVPGRNDIVLVELSCESCSHLWRMQVRIADTTVPTTKLK